MNARFDWVEAQTLNDALGQLKDGALVKAGGVDVIDRLKEGLDEPKRLVNIRNIGSLHYVREEGGMLRIGPLATLAQLDENATVRQKYTALADACGKAATPQIRNMATVGGNILQRPRCWYFRNQQFHCLKKGGAKCFAQEGENDYHAIFDNAVCAIVHPSAAAMALVAMSARLELSTLAGKREVLLEEFFLTPEDDVTRENKLAANELITEIRVPALAQGARSAYMKLGEKQSFDWPIAEVAVVLEQAGGTVRKASVIMGAAAPIPWRAKEAEQMLVGKPLDEATAAAAARVALRGARPMRNNGYKLPVFEAVIKRTLLAAGGEKARA